MTKREFRSKVVQSGLFSWQVAEKMGVSVDTLMRWQRGGFDGEREQLVLAAIEELKQEQEQAARAWQQAQDMEAAYYGLCSEEEEIKRQALYIAHERGLIGWR